MKNKTCVELEELYNSNKKRIAEQNSIIEGINSGNIFNKNQDDRKIIHDIISNLVSENDSIFKELNIRRIKIKEDKEKDAAVITSLTKENLLLQNKGLKNRWIYGILGFFGGLIISNLKWLLELAHIINK
ncbi:MAG: hypothetical protein ACYDCN_13025 [Bacteroidia bacterium]